MNTFWFDREGAGKLAMVRGALWLALLALLPKVTQADEEILMPPADFIGRYEAALATQEWENVSPLIHDQASVVFSNGTVHKGKDAVQAAFERNFRAIEHERYQMRNVHWLLEKSDTAVFMFDFEWAGIIDGKEASGGGRGTSVLVNEDGRWLLLAEHLGYPEH